MVDDYRDRCDRPCRLCFGPHIWPMAPGIPMPPANFLPGYILLSATEALAFGFAVAFAFFGWPAVRGLGLGAPWLNKWLFVTLCWFVGNWWMHDSLHMHNGMNMHGLLFIETVFQITMLICGVTMALSLVRLAPHSAAEWMRASRSPFRQRSRGRWAMHRLGNKSMFENAISAKALIEHRSVTESRPVSSDLDSSTLNCRLQGESLIHIRSMSTSPIMR
jgi:hypothetical protein